MKSLKVNANSTILSSHKISLSELLNYFIALSYTLKSNTDFRYAAQSHSSLHHIQYSYRYLQTS